ncbi:hypothetical protein LGR54_18020 [Ancylobacter sp. Lp-2]|uniref:hypothetical protein n=1 Tax=Ancylobacter sp. Lp-2 TaxID=2881339 RepID=UPI001E474992|nr:hypothetical protein [Ancylobacter sp. Lp-2]MCB4770508.1 hypothetical protein [Ancylobacter sp. Lp-2]
MNQDQIVNGLSLQQWEAAFRPGITEFSATTFAFTNEGQNLVRIALGNHGPYKTADGNREPVFTHAVTLTPETAVNLAGLLLKFYAEPKDQQHMTSAEL